MTYNHPSNTSPPAKLYIDMYIYARQVNPQLKISINPIFFIRGACFDQSSGQHRVNPGKQEGGDTKKSNYRRVFFSRYLAVNDGALRSHSDVWAPLRGGLVINRVLIARARALGNVWTIHVHRANTVTHTRQTQGHRVTDRQGRTTIHVNGPNASVGAVRLRALPLFLVQQGCLRVGVSRCGPAAVVGRGC